MKILDSFITGIMRTIKSWKGIVIIWLVSILLAGLLAIPVKGSLNAGFGSSAVTEKLNNGFDIEVFADLGNSFKSLGSYLSNGMIMIMIVVFITNSFLSGGMFNSLRGFHGKFYVSEFFRASSARFWSFFFISLLLSLMILLLAIIIIVVPLTIVFSAEGISEAGAYKTCIAAIALFILILTTVLSVADYARAWQVVNDANDSFKAIGFGFRHTFRTFSSSFPLMLILLAVQIFFVWLVFQIILPIKSQSGIGIIFLFLISQFLYFIRLLLKTWRYGSVTVMMEKSIS
jgi:hypothetical protein